MAKKLLTGLTLVNLPSDPSVGSEGELYFNTSASVVKLYKNAEWSEIGSGGSGIVVSETDPVSPAVGDAWYQNTTNSFYVYDGTFWVEVNTVIGLTEEDIQYYVSPLFVHENHENISAIYDDINNQVVLSASGGVAIGGTAGQTLVKIDGTDYNTEWTTPAPGGVTSFNSDTGAITGVNSISGTAPIVSTGTTTPVISIDAATTSVAGSMSSADKVKLDAVVTGSGVAAGGTVSQTLTKVDGTDYNTEWTTPDTSPTLVTPNIGAATGTSLTTTGNIISHISISTPTFTTNNYTALSSDDGKLLMLDNSTTAGTLLIPTDATYDFTIGTQINVIQKGTGLITIEAVTPSTTTINSTPGNKLRAQWSSATVIKTGANVWLLMGDLTAV